MSASAIADGLVTVLASASVLGSGAVSRNSYQVLESASDSAAVVSWLSLRSRPQAFGDPRARQREWTFQVELFTKDLGDPAAAMDRQLAAMDKVVQAIESDDTLQDTAEASGEVRISREVGTVRNYAGAAWLYASLEVDVSEFV